MKVPVCCGKEMKINMETPLYIEVECKTCGDAIFVKKDNIKKPQLIDD